MEKVLSNSDYVPAMMYPGDPLFFIRKCSTCHLNKILSSENFLIRRPHAKTIRFPHCIYRTQCKKCYNIQRARRRRIKKLKYDVIGVVDFVVANAKDARWDIIARAMETLEKGMKHAKVGSLTLS